MGLKMELNALLTIKTFVHVLIMIASESVSCCRKVTLCFDLCTLNHGMCLLELTGYYCQHGPTQDGAHLPLFFVVLPMCALVFLISIAFVCLHNPARS